MQVECLLHSLEQAVKGIGLYMKSIKTEFIYFQQAVDIFTLNGKPLKLVDHFIYCGSNISSTESEVKITC